MFDWFFNIIQEIWWSYVGHSGTNECMLSGKGEIWTSLGRISFYCIIGFILALYIFIVIKGIMRKAKEISDANLISLRDRGDIVSPKVLNI